MSAQNQDRSPIYVLFLPRPVIWNVVLLELLGDVIRRRHVGSAVAKNHGQFPGPSEKTRKHLLLPHVITRQAYDGDKQKRKIEHRISP